MLSGKVTVTREEPQIPGDPAMPKSAGNADASEWLARRSCFPRYDVFWRVCPDYSV